ncbi:Defective in cullin neddylation protein [Balamuthia mandrillaris]
MQSSKKTLTITVEGGRKLSRQKANCYCEVTVLDKKGEKLCKPKNTKVLKGSNPEWRQSLTFALAASEFTGLIVRCWDKHTFRRDVFMGQITIKFNTELLEGQDSIDQWFPLNKSGGKKKENVSGDIRLKIQYGGGKDKGGSSSKDKEKEEEEEEEEEENARANAKKNNLKVSGKWHEKDQELVKSALVVVDEDDTPSYHSGDDDDADYESNRKGPSHAALDKLLKDSKLTFANKNLEVTNANTSGYGWEYAKGNVRVSGGKWYYEAVMSSYGQMMVGWCTDDYDPTKNTGEAWSYDITNQRTQRGGGQTQSYGDHCSSGDVISCTFDVDANNITFYRNGTSLGEAFTDATSPSPDTRLRPFVALGRNTKARFNFGRDTFAHANIVPDGYHPLHCKLSEAQIKELSKLFNEYRAAGIDLSESAEDVGDIIQGNGALKYQEDMGATDDEDPLMMVVAWKLNCQITWEITRQEFVDGWAIYGCHTLKQMKDKAAEWKKDIEGDGPFQSFYYFVFDYLRGEKKILMTEEAELVWDMLLKPRGWQLYGSWLEFLHKKEKKAISRDVWQQLLEFRKAYSKDLSEYDEMAAWPLIFDEFVEWHKGDGEGDGAPMY